LTVASLRRSGINGNPTFVFRVDGDVLVASLRRSGINGNLIKGTNTADIKAWCKSLLFGEVELMETNCHEIGILPGILIVASLRRSGINGNN